MCSLVFEYKSPAAAILFDFWLEVCDQWQQGKKERRKERRKRREAKTICCYAHLDPTSPPAA